MSFIMYANVDVFKKPAGILKTCEVVFGMITMSLCAEATIVNSTNVHAMTRSECFLLIASCTFFLISLLMIISCVFSDATESKLRQTLFEPIYHFVALVLYFSGSVAVLASNPGGSRHRIDSLMAAGGIGIVTSMLYGVSAFDSYKGYVTE